MKRKKKSKKFIPKPPNPLGVHADARYKDQTDFKTSDEPRDELLNQAIERIAAIITEDPDVQNV